MKLTNWPEVGNTVAIYTAGFTATVRLARVARLTTTQVILDDDTRWRRDDLTEVGKRGSTWDVRRELRRPDDILVRSVRSALARAHLRQLVWKIEDAAKNVRELNDVVGALHAIEGLVTATSRAVTRLEKPQ